MNLKNPKLFLSLVIIIWSSGYDYEKERSVKCVWFKDDIDFLLKFFQDKPFWTGWPDHTGKTLTHGHVQGGSVCSNPPTVSVSQDPFLNLMLSIPSWTQDDYPSKINWAHKLPVNSNITKLKPAWNLYWSSPSWLQVETLFHECVLPLGSSWGGIKFSTEHNSDSPIHRIFWLCAITPIGNQSNL